MQKMAALIICIVLMLGAQTKAEALVIYSDLFVGLGYPNVVADPTTVTFSTLYDGVPQSEIFAGFSFNAFDNTNVGRMFTVSAGDPGFAEYSS